MPYERRPKTADALRGHGHSARTPLAECNNALSRLGLIAAVANRHSAFQCRPYPAETLCPDVQLRQPADPHAELDACAASYLNLVGN